MSDRRPFPPPWAAIADPDTGQLPTGMPLDTLLVRENVELQADALKFSWEKGSSNLRYFRPPASLLERFVSLRTDAAIARFAQRFGPLWLTVVGADFRPTPRPFRLDRQRGEHVEHVGAWRRYIDEVNALLSLAVAIRQEEDVRRQDIEVFERSGGIVPAPFVRLNEVLGPPQSVLHRWESWSRADRLRAATHLLRTRTTEFVKWCELRPVLDAEFTKTDLIFQDATSNDVLFGLSLFGAITVQLLAAVTGSGFAVCSACGKAFSPKRRQPAFGKRRFCSACGRPAAVRLAQAEFRRRRRERTEKSRAARAIAAQRRQDGKK